MRVIHKKSSKLFFIENVFIRLSFLMPEVLQFHLTNGFILICEEEISRNVKLSFLFTHVQSNIAPLIQFADL